MFVSFSFFDTSGRNMGAMMVMETDHETAWHTWDYRWCRVIDCGALLASMVAKESVALA
jgi:hypothetical protein